jgi:hypothetical protein
MYQTSNCGCKGLPKCSKSFLFLALLTLTPSSEKCPFLADSNFYLIAADFEKRTPSSFFNTFYKSNMPIEIGVFNSTAVSTLSRL